MLYGCVHRYFNVNLGAPFPRSHHFAREWPLENGGEEFGRTLEIDSVIRVRRSSGMEYG